MARSHDPQQNHLLAALSAAERDRIAYAAVRPRIFTLVNGKRTVTTRPVPAAGADRPMSPARSATLRQTTERPRPLPREPLADMR
jgi:hypothetical protein